MKNEMHVPAITNTLLDTLQRQYMAGSRNREQDLKAAERRFKIHNLALSNYVDEIIDEYFVLTESRTAQLIDGLTQGITTFIPRRSSRKKVLETYFLLEAQSQFVQGDDNSIAEIRPDSMKIRVEPETIQRIEETRTGQRGFIRFGYPQYPQSNELVIASSTLPVINPILSRRIDHLRSSQSRIERAAGVGTLAMLAAMSLQVRKNNR